jgi:RNA recognition motif-containing protein
MMITKLANYLNIISKSKKEDIDKVFISVLLSLKLVLSIKYCQDFILSLSLSIVFTMILLFFNKFLIHFILHLIKDLLIKWKKSTINMNAHFMFAILMKKLIVNCWKKFLFRFIIFLIIIVILIYFKAGPIESVTVREKSEKVSLPGKSPEKFRFAFVEFSHVDSVLFACKILDAIELYGKKLKVTPRDNTKQVFLIFLF